MNTSTRAALRPSGARLIRFARPAATLAALAALAAIAAPELRAADAPGYITSHALGGNVLDLAGDGAGHAAALIGQRLVVMDVGADGPRPVAESAVLPGDPRAVALSQDGSMAYVAVGFGGVVVVDIASHRSSPAPGGPPPTVATAPIVAQLPAPNVDDPSYTLPGIYAVTVAGDTLYTLGAHRLTLYDIHQPGRPLQLSVLTLQDEYHSVAAGAWGAALVGQPATGGAHVLLVSAADRHRPVEAAVIGRGSTGGGRLVADDRRVILADGPTTMLIDTTDPWEPLVQTLPLRLTDLAIQPADPNRVVALGRVVSGPSAGAFQLMWLDLTVPTAARTLAVGAQFASNARVVALDPASLEALGVDENGFALTRPDAQGAIVEVGRFATFGPVQSAASLDADHIVIRIRNDLAIVRTADDAVVATVPSGGVPWHALIVVGRWAFVAFARSSLAVTPIDLRVPSAPVRHDPISFAGSRFDRLLGAEGWFAAVSDTAVTVWSVSSDGPSAFLRDVPLDHTRNMSLPIVALSSRELFVLSGHDVRAYDLRDLSTTRTVLDAAGREDGAAAILAADDRWLLVRRQDNRLWVVRPDRPADAPREVPGRGVALSAIIDGDNAAVFGSGFLGTDRSGFGQLVVGRVDLARALLDGLTPLGSIVGPVHVRRSNGVGDGGQHEVSVLGANRSLQTWRWSGSVPPTATPLPTATRPIPTARPPAARVGVFLPYLALSRPSAKPPVQLVPESRIGGQADTIVLDGEVAWLCTRGTLTAVDIGADPLRALGSVALGSVTLGSVTLGSVADSRMSSCSARSFSASGGRLAVVSHDGVLTFVDVSDPRQPRVAGRHAAGASDGGSLIIAPWPGRPLFLRMRHVRDRSSAASGSGTELTLFDASDANQPRLVRTVLREEVVERLIVGDGVVLAIGYMEYQGESQGELQVWRFTEAGDLSVLGRLEIAFGLVLEPFDNSVSIDPAGDRLYITPLYQSNIVTFDVSDPAHPRLAESLDVDEAILSTQGDLPSPFARSGLQAVGKSVVLTFPTLRAVVVVPNVPSRASAKIVDVPAFLSDSLFAASTHADAMAAAGDRLVIAGGLFGGLSVIDGLAGEAPTVRTLAGVGGVRGVAGAPGGGSRLLFSGGGADVLQEIDVADAAVVRTSASARSDQRTRAGFEWYWPSAVEIAVGKTGAWTAEGSAGLSGFRIDDTGAPFAAPGGLEEGTADRDGMRLAVAAVGPFALTAHPRRGIEIWDDSGHTGPPQRVAQLSTGGDPEDVAVVGTHAFVADGAGGMLVLDVRNPAAVRSVHRLRLPGSAVRLAVDARRRLAWVALERRAGRSSPLGGIGGGRLPSALAAVDISDAAAPRLLGVLGLPTARLRDIALADDLVLVSGALHDADDGPLELYSYQQTPALYAVDADPLRPAVRGAWTGQLGELAGGGIAVLPDGRVAYAAGEDGLRIVRIERSGP